MTTNVPLVVGRVVDTAHHAAGAYGFSVEAWVGTDAGAQHRLGVAVTHGDGSFSITQQPNDATSTESSKQIELRVLDVRDRCVATRKLSVRQVALARAITLRVRSDARHEHETLLIKVAGPDPSFLPVPDMVAFIARSIPLVATPGSPDFERFLQAAKCPMPPFRQMNELYRDAHGVLGGDPWAVRRFIDNLGMMESSVHSPPDSPSAHSPRIGRPHTHRRITPADGPAVVPTKSVPIFIAGAMLAKAGLYKLEQFTNTIASVIGDFENLGLIHRIALDANHSEDARSRLASVLDSRFPECGPRPGGGAPGIVLPEPRRGIPWLDWHQECLDLSVAAVASDPPPYTITQVDPVRACPADTISVRGTGFGLAEGLVVFRRLGGGTLEVSALSWNNTLITVKVPSQAASGLWLKIPASPVIVCGTYVERYVTGQVTELFDGSAPVIEALYAGTPHPPFMVEPGGFLHINWRVYGATLVTVEVFDEYGVSLARSDPAPSIGTFASLTAPPGNTTTKVRVRLRAEGICNPKVVTSEIEILVTKDPLLIIEGIEVTQAVQHYRSSLHLTDSADFGPDNSLPIVAGKAAYARVYLRSLRDPTFDYGTFRTVTGSLIVERLAGTSVIASDTLLPTPPDASVIVWATPVYKIVRGLLETTLNFLIPAQWMTARVRLTVNIKGESGKFIGVAPSATLTVEPSLNRRLRIAYIPVGYDGPTSPEDTTPLQLGAPTIADLLTTLGKSLALFPVTALPDIRMLMGHTRTNVLSTDGNLKANFNDISFPLYDIVVADGDRTDVVYVALLAGGTPGFMGGTGGSPTICHSGNQIALVHEIGHALGRAHAPCGSVPFPDPNYPAYEPYDTEMAKQAVIGEYGIDIRDGTLHRATPLILDEDIQEHDFMSYCDPRWISPYGYLHAHGNLAGLSVPPSAPVGGSPMGFGPLDGPIQVLWVSGSIKGNERFEVRRVAHVDLHAAPVGRPLSAVTELLDAEGILLAASPLRRRDLEGHRHNDSPDEADSVPAHFDAYLPVLSNAVRMRIRRGNIVVWEREKPRTRPSVKLTHCRVGPDQHLALRWKSKLDSAASSDVWLQWRSADSTEWRALDVGVRTKQANIPVECLPAGRIQIRVLLHDGFSTVGAESAPILIPARAPRVGIINPVEDSALKAGATLLLWGYASNCHGRSLPDEGLTWRVNGKIIGTGLTVPMPLKRGKGLRYRIELVAKDEHGTARATTTIRTQDEVQRSGWDI